MHPDHVDRVARLLPRGAGVREFADREFPREDYHWVASTTRAMTPRRDVRRGVWSRLVALFVTAGDGDGDTPADPALA